MPSTMSAFTTVRTSTLAAGARALAVVPTLRVCCAALLPGLAVSLSGCGSDVPKFPPVCPNTGILSDAADLTRFKSAGTDLTDMVLDGRITGITGKCSLDDAAHLRTSIAVSMDLTRGPAANSRQADVQYFISVERGDRILDKKTYTLAVNFQRNADRLRLEGNQIDIVLPVGDTAKGSDYRVLVGFQLDPAELAFNRVRGAR